MEENNQSQNPSLPVSQDVKTSPSPPPVFNIEKPKPKFSVFIIIVIILFLLITGGAAGFYFVKQKSSNPVVTTTPTPTVSNPSPVPDPTADWKTYANTQLGFSVRYPADILVDANEVCPNKVDHLALYALVNKKDMDENPGLFCTVALRELIVGASFSEKPQEKSDEFWEVTKEQISLGRIEAEKYTSVRIKLYEGTNSPLTKTVNVLVNNNGKQFSIFYGSPSQVSEDLFNQILSTLKFNQNQNTDLTILLPTGWYFKENSAQRIFMVDENGMNNVTFTKYQTQNLVEMIQIAKKGIVRDLTLIKHMIDDVEVTEYTGCLDLETCNKTSKIVLPIKDAYYIIHSPDPDRAVLEKILAGVRLKS